MNETIDPTHWLHASPHKVYKTAMERIGAVVRGRGIVCSSRFAFDELYRWPENEPILGGSHLSAAEFFVTLRQVALFKSDYARLREIILGMDGIGVEGLSGFCPMTLYLHALKPLSRWQRAMIERICLHELRDNDRGWVIQCKENIRDSFDRLGEGIELALDNMRRKTENISMNRGEVCPKSTQPVSGN